MILDVESVLDSFIPAFIDIIELKEVTEVGQICEDAIVPEKMHGMLVIDSKLLFFILLLVLDDEVVKEYLIELVHTFLYAKLNALYC
jgi:hypothetical protein